MQITVAITLPIIFIIKLEEKNIFEKMQQIQILINNAEITGM